jgi:hypothetical protein
MQLSCQKVKNLEIIVNKGFTRIASQSVLGGASQINDANPGAMLKTLIN